MYKEGKAVIKYERNSFLNPDALISRDISAAFVSAFAEKGSRILDCTSATGIRGIRYYLESKAKDLTFLEINSKSFSSMKKNVVSNKVKGKMLNTSMQELANASKDRFDFIDLDPFGGVTPYIYDMMKISKGSTYLMISATDTAVLCGADYRACVRLYDAKPMHNELCQEVGLRILIGYIARVAAQFNFGIEVVLSFSYLHYIRVFIRLDHGAKSAFESIKSLGYAYYCNKCLYRGVQKSLLPSIVECELCGNKLETAGKMWLGKLYDRNTILSVIAEMESGVADGRYDKKSLNFINTLSKEPDVPLYYSIPQLTKKMHIGAVSPNMLIDKLLKKKYNASLTHLEKSCIKTNAGIEEMKRLVKDGAK